MTLREFATGTFANQPSNLGKRRQLCRMRARRQSDAREHKGDNSRKSEREVGGVEGSSWSGEGRVEREEALLEAVSMEREVENKTSKKS